MYGIYLYISIKLIFIVLVLTLVYRVMYSQFLLYVVAYLYNWLRLVGWELRGCIKARSGSVCRQQAQSLNREGIRITKVGVDVQSDIL